jgi:hypothetical protein
MAQNLGDFGFQGGAGASIIPGTVVTVEYTMTSVNLPIDGDNIIAHDRLKLCLGIASLRDSTGKSIAFQDWRNDPSDPTKQIIINIAGTYSGCTLVLLFANV